MDELRIIPSMEAQAGEDHPPTKIRKTSKGKQKIDIIKRENKESRQVTFSKRRSGLFKKCDTLCSNYNAQIAVITFSEAGKLYPYGYPNPEAVIQRYINNSNNYDHGHNYGVKVEEGRRLSSLLSDDRNNNGASVNSNCGFWWENVQVENLELRELEELKVALERERNQVVSKVGEVNRNSTSLVLNNRRFGFEDLDCRVVINAQDFGSGDLITQKYGARS